MRVHNIRLVRVMVNCSHRGVAETDLASVTAVAQRCRWLHHAHSLFLDQTAGKVAYGGVVAQRGLLERRLVAVRLAIVNHELVTVVTLKRLGGLSRCHEVLVRGCLHLLQRDLEGSLV